LHLEVLSRRVVVVSAVIGAQVYDFNLNTSQKKKPAAPQLDFFRNSLSTGHGLQRLVHFFFAGFFDLRCLNSSKLISLLFKLLRHKSKESRIWKTFLVWL